MTRKDYQLIAQIISSVTSEMIDSSDSGAFEAGQRYFRSRVISGLIHEFRKDNSNFDVERFRSACLGS